MFFLVNSSMLRTIATARIKGRRTLLGLDCRKRVTATKTGQCINQARSTVDSKECGSETIHLRSKYFIYFVL